MLTHSVAIWSRMGIAGRPAIVAAVDTVKGRTRSTRAPPWGERLLFVVMTRAFITTPKVRIAAGQQLSPILIESSGDPYPYRLPIKGNATKQEGTMRNDSAIRFAAMLATLAVAGMLAIACGQGGEPTSSESGGDSSQPSGSSNPSQEQLPTRNNNTSASNRASQDANTSPAATSAGQRGDDRGASVFAVATPAPAMERRPRTPWRAPRPACRFRHQWRRPVQLKALDHRNRDRRFLPNPVEPRTPMTARFRWYISSITE